MTAAVPRVSPLIGRADALARLAAEVGLSAERPGDAAVLLAGDAGVGKTRLLSELREQALAAGWQVLVGHCLDFGDSGLPYLAFSEVFGRLTAEQPPVAEALLAELPAVARLMPRRRTISADGAAAGEQQIDRLDLLEAVHAALRRLSATAPVLLLVEDVHWADQSTRELLTFLFTRRFEAPVAVVASYRSDDLHRRHPLRATAAAWARLPGVARLQLDPLSDADVRALVRALHPGALGEADVRRIVERAEGNAFFTEELVAVVELDGRSLPTDLAHLLLVRIDQLDEDSRTVVRAASVAGRRVSHALLARVVPSSADGLDRSIRTAVDANVLIPVGAGSYGFRHALLAEAVYDDLLPGERVRLHSAYATALRSSPGEGTAAELARHARAAHDLPTAVGASIEAGDEAMGLGGPDEAARHFEVALELIAEIGGSPIEGDAGDVVTLGVKAGTAWVAAGDAQRAVALLQEQLAGLPAGVADLERARLLVAVAGTALLTENSSDLREITGEALRLVPEDPPSAVRARAMNIHARAHADRRRDDEAARWATEALAMARSLQLPDVVADASTTLAHVEQRAGDAQTSRRSLIDTVAEARGAGEVAAELRGLFSLGLLAYEVGDLDEAVARLQEAAERGRVTGRPWAPYAADSRALAATASYVSGHWDEAARLSDLSGESPPGLARATLVAAGLAVAAGRGETQALDRLAALRPWWQGDGVIAIMVAAAAADLLGDSGDLTAATAVHNDAIACITELWQRPSFDARLRMSAVLLGQVATRAGQAGSADRPALLQQGDQLYADGIAVLERARATGRNHGPEAHAWAARLRAEHLRLRWLAGTGQPAESEIIEAWEHAVEAFDRFGHVFETARSRARLAAVLRAAGRTAEAAALADLAAAVADRLGARPLQTEVAALFGRNAPLPSADGRSGGTGRADEALTPREQEVLALVAQGRSNRDIGAVLFISTKTVSVHVSNILAKLAASGRTEAVAVARAKGLLSD